jgi:uncharacterized membrane protein YtjA (UPF0391 family)
LESAGFAVHRRRNGHGPAELGAGFPRDRGDRGDFGFGGVAEGAAGGAADIAKLLFGLFLVAFPVLAALGVMAYRTVT